MSEQIRWMSTKEAAEHLGVTLRSLYRFIDEGRWSRLQVRPGHPAQGRRCRRVHRVTAASPPGSLEHLYPEVKGSTGRRAERAESQ